jgi:hypothetical protein
MADGGCPVIALRCIPSENDTVFNLIKDNVYKKSLSISDHFIFHMVAAIGPHSITGHNIDGSVPEL